MSCPFFCWDVYMSYLSLFQSLPMCLQSMITSRPSCSESRSRQVSTKRSAIQVCTKSSVLSSGWSLICRVLWWSIILPMCDRFWNWCLYKMESQETGNQREKWIERRKHFILTDFIKVLKVNCFYILFVLCLEFFSWIKCLDDSAIFCCHDDAGILVVMVFMVIFFLVVFSGGQ